MSQRRHPRFASQFPTYAFLVSQPYTHCVCSVCRQLQLEPQQETEPISAATSQPGPQAKPRVVILGSGWGAISFLKGLPDNIRCGDLRVSPMPVQCGRSVI